MLLDQSSQITPSLGFFDVVGGDAVNFFSSSDCSKLANPQPSQSMAVMISNQLPTAPSPLSSFPNQKTNAVAGTGTAAGGTAGSSPTAAAGYKEQTSEGASVSSFDCHSSTSFLGDAADLSTPASPVVLSNNQNVTHQPQPQPIASTSSNSEIELARRLGVRFDSSNAAWVARWIEPHSVKKKSRWFSVAKYGELAARRLAIQACLQNTKQSDLAALTDLHEVLASFITPVSSTAPHGLINPVPDTAAAFPYSNKQFQTGFLHHPLLAAQTGPSAAAAAAAAAFVNSLGTSPYITVPPAATPHGLLMLPPSFDGLLYQGVPENHAAWGYCVSDDQNSGDTARTHIDPEHPDFVDECLEQQHFLIKEEKERTTSEVEQTETVAGETFKQPKNSHSGYTSADTTQSDNAEQNSNNTTENKLLLKDFSSNNHLLQTMPDGKYSSYCPNNTDSLVRVKTNLELTSNGFEDNNQTSQNWNKDNFGGNSNTEDGLITTADQTQPQHASQIIKSEDLSGIIKKKDDHLITQQQQENMMLLGASHGLPYAAAAADYGRDLAHQTGILAYHPSVLGQTPSPQLHPFMTMSPFAPQDSRFLYQMPPQMDKQQQRLLMHQQQQQQQQQPCENVLRVTNKKVKKSHTDDSESEEANSDDLHSSKSIKQSDEEDESFNSFSDFEQQRKKKKRRLARQASNEKFGVTGEEDENKEKQQTEEMSSNEDSKDGNNQEAETDDEDTEAKKTQQEQSQHDDETKNQEYIGSLNGFSEMNKDHNANNLYLYQTGAAGAAPVSPQFLSSARYYSPSPQLYPFSTPQTGQSPGDSTPFLTSPAPPGAYQFPILPSHLHPGFLPNFHSQLDLAAAGGPALYHLSSFQQAHLGHLGHLGLHQGGSRPDLQFPDESLGQQMGAAGGYKRVQPNNMSQMMTAKMTCERGLHYSKCYRGKEECWIAVWNTKGGRIMHEAFDVNQMGFEQAKSKAREARDAAHSNNIAVAENSRPSWKSHSNTGIPHVSLDSQQLRFRAHKFGRRLCRSFSFGRRRGSYPNRESAFDAAVLWLIQTPTEEEIATVSGASSKIEDPTNI